jgi:hypothetical protein
MPIVAAEYRKTKQEVTDLLSNMQDIDITPEFLLMTDFAYHNADNDYDEGLSFLDRLHWKISIYYQINWNVVNLKNTIRASNNPSETFVMILNEILTDDMVACYGV